MPWKHQCSSSVDIVLWTSNRIQEATGNSPSRVIALIMSGWIETDVYLRSYRVFTQYTILQGLYFPPASNAKRGVAVVHVRMS